MSRDKKSLHAELVRAYESAKDMYAGMYPDFPQPFITCTHRTAQEQDALYAKGRTTQGAIVTNAKAGQSPHNHLPSFAFDIAFITLEKKLSWDQKYFKYFADCVKAVAPGVDWGGDWRFKDAPHFELKAWKRIVEAR